MLDVKKVLAKILNRLPESGSNSNGSYMKFPDGTLICTKKVSGTYSFPNRFGDWYETSSGVQLGNWAHSFISTPIINVTIGSRAAVSEAIQGLSATSAGFTYLMRPNNVSNYIELNVIGIGRWKQVGG